MRVLERHGYGSNGECVGLDANSFRTTTTEHGLDHAINSRKTFLRLLKKVREYDEGRAQALIDARD